MISSLGRRAFREASKQLRLSYMSSLNTSLVFGTLVSQGVLCLDYGFLTMGFLFRLFHTGALLYLFNFFLCGLLLFLQAGK